MPRTPQIPPSDIYLMEEAKKAGFLISVEATDDGEVLVEKERYSSRGKIEKVLGDLDEAILMFHDADGTYKGSALIVYEYGQRNEEIITNYSSDLWVEEVMDGYYRKYVR